MPFFERLFKTSLLFLLGNLLILFGFFISLPTVANLLISLALIGFFLWFNLRPRSAKISDRRLRLMIGGYDLMVTAGLCLFFQILWYLYLLFFHSGLPDLIPTLLANLLFFLPVVFILMINGFFRMLFTSVQIGIVLRIAVLFLWWLPLVNLILIRKVCKTVRLEYWTETAKLELNKTRQELEICKTKYPIVLVHGIFFRDWQLFNYWGRIPKELLRNGARVYYGGQQSAAAVADSAAELKENILRLVRTTGCEKVNIIAHSKGGLDSRYAISKLGLSPYVASLTTVNTPHRGVIFGEILLEKLPAFGVRWLEKRYNAVFHTLGDKDPDFLAGVTDLTASRCAAMNEDVPDVPGVYYQSVMSVMTRPSSAGFPLNFTYRLVKKYDKEPNDGLVALSSAPWGRYLGKITVKGRRGISHGDMIDLTRENIPGFDVREFYVRLVKDLRENGY